VLGSPRRSISCLLKTCQTLTSSLWAMAKAAYYSPVRAVRRSWSSRQCEEYLTAFQADSIIAGRSSVPPCLVIPPTRLMCPRESTRAPKLA
jgi:hypothetical protein